MYKCFHHLKYLLAATMLIGSGYTLAQPNTNKPPLSEEQIVAKMLRDADAYRLKDHSAKIVSVIKLYTNGELDKTRRFHVYAKRGKESLVIFKSRSDTGQKMLMLKDNYWLLMPKSRRPIRITPMQKLLGDASIGDVATLIWSAYYRATFIATQKIDEQMTNLLELEAKSDGSSYQRIELWLDQYTNFPIKAKMYLRSGKLAKVARFTSGTIDNETRVTEMQLTDQIQISKMTVIEYQKIEPMKLDEKYYNPDFLAHNSVSGL